MNKGLLKAARVLAKIADRYDDNSLDDEARKRWGENDEHTSERPPKDIILYSGRGGGTLLTLQDCLDARDAVRLEKEQFVARQQANSKWCWSYRVMDAENSAGNLRLQMFLHYEDRIYSSPIVPLQQLRKKNKEENPKRYMNEKIRETAAVLFRMSGQVEVEEGALPEDVDGNRRYEEL